MSKQSPIHLAFSLGVVAIAAIAADAWAQTVITHSGDGRGCMICLDIAPGTVCGNHNADVILHCSPGQKAMCGVIFGFHYAVCVCDPESLFPCD